MQVVLGYVKWDKFKKVIDKAKTSCQIQNNSSVRKMLIQRGIEPENLPPEEDIKKLERRAKREEKRLTEENRLQNPEK